MQEVVQAS